MPTLPSTMNAVLLTGHGGVDRLEYRRDVRVPRPAADEVLVRVGAAGINNTDVNLRVGWYSKLVPEGATVVGIPGRVVRTKIDSPLGALEHGRIAACAESEPADMEQLNDRIRELEATLRLLLEDRVGQARG